MVSYKINDIKIFMRDLLIEGKFDEFLVTEASVTTYNTYTIDGHINKSYYTSEEYEELEEKELSPWKVIKPICYFLIKGKKLPVRFKIILQLSEKYLLKFLDNNKLNLDPSAINGLYLNLKFEDNNLTCITGCSLNVFTLDKTLENSWDESIKKFLVNYDIE